MVLEDQTVPKEKVEKIVQGVLREREIKGNQFFTDKS